MDYQATSSPPRKGLLFYLVAGLAILTVILYFNWRSKVNRTTRLALAAKEAAAAAESAPVLITSEVVAPPVEIPPVTEPDIKVNPTKLLPNTSFTIISKPDLHRAEPDTSADTLEFMLDGKMFRFQLPGIEALVTSSGKPDVRAAQADFFKSDAVQIGIRGDNARDWVHGLLKQHNYQVLTNWQLAVPGVYFAHVFVETESGGWSFLNELLLSRGEARLTEQPLLPPLRMASEKDFLERHRQAQSHAQKQKAGAWATQETEAP